MARKIRTRKQNKNYWSDRMVAIEAMNHETAIDTYRKAEKALNAAQASIDRDIAYWLMRIAKNNGISMAEARKLLQGAELEEFKWTVEEYIARGRAGGVDEEWIKQLENASARAHITRLEALKLSLRNHLETAYGIQSAGVSDLLSTVYQNSYHRTAYEVQKGTGVGFTFGRVDTRKLDKVINSPWAADGSSWSDRVWTRKTLMTNTLQNELTRTILSGEAPDKAIENMTQFVGDNVKNAKAAAGRLVMTESAAIASSAQKDCYKELGVEEFQIIATLDRLTCDVCGPLDEQHFPVKEFGVGASVPPFHPNCRCTTAPYFDDEFEHDGERAYRGDDGKTHYVEDMSYEEWSKTYLRADKMATSGTSVWPEPVKQITQDEYKDVMSYARGKGIEMSGVKKFDGEIKTIKEVIEDANSIAERYPAIKEGKRKLTIAISSTMQDDDYAVTNGHIISINRNAFRNIDLLKQDYDAHVREKWFVQGSNYRSIIIHEIGHVVANKYNIDGRSIAESITGLRGKELSLYIEQNLSRYAASVHDGSEIISEVFSAVYSKNTDPNEFALRFMDECNKIIAKGR